jgi:DNA-directed RNA polymerase subunit RPC12/RpoP
MNEGVEVKCSCGKTFIYRGTSRRYARCPKCRQRREIFRIIKNRENTI